SACEFEEVLVRHRQYIQAEGFDDNSLGIRDRTKERFEHSAGDAGHPGGNVRRNQRLAGVQSASAEQQDKMDSTRAHWITRMDWPRREPWWCALASRLRLSQPRLRSQSYSGHR